MWLPEIVGEPDWDRVIWTLIFTGALIGVLLLGDWLRSWWVTNLLRNHIAAKRRLRRDGRDVDVKPD